MPTDPLDIDQFLPPRLRRSRTGLTTRRTDPLDDDIEEFLPPRLRTVAAPEEPEEPGFIERYATPAMALRIGLPIAGGIIGSAIPGPGTAAGAALGATLGAGLGGAAGEYAAEKLEGREDVDLGEVALAGGLSAIPAGPAARLAARPGLSLLRRAALYGAEGAAQGALDVGATTAYREGRLPTAEELGGGVVAGTVLGGALGTGLDAVTRARLRTPLETAPVAETAPLARPDFDYDLTPERVALTPQELAAEQALLTPDLEAAAAAETARRARAFLAERRALPGLEEAMAPPGPPRLTGLAPFQGDEVTFSPAAAEAAAEQGVRVEPRPEPLPTISPRDSAEAARMARRIQSFPEEELRRRQAFYERVKFPESLKAVREEISRRQQEAGPRQPPRQPPPTAAAQPSPAQPQPPRPPATAAVPIPSRDDLTLDRVVDETIPAAITALEKPGGDRGGKVFQGTDFVTTLAPGMHPAKVELGLESLPEGAGKIASALRKDKDNPLYLRAREAMKDRLDEMGAAATPSATPEGPSRVGARPDASAAATPEGQPITPPPQEGTASVPAFIPRNVEQGLADLGYTREQRSAMKPDEAQRILAAQERPTVPEASQRGEVYDPETGRVVASYDSIGEAQAHADQVGYQWAPEGMVLKKSGYGFEPRSAQERPTVQKAPETTIAAPDDLQPIQPEAGLAEGQADRRRDVVVDRREAQAPVDVDRRFVERRQRIAEEHPDFPPEATDLIAKEQIRADDAETDPITKLPGRARFERDVATHQGPAASMDLAGVKWINDNLGHPAGDALLRAFGEAATAEPGVRIYRTGGDEFYLLSESDDVAHAAARSIQERFRGARFSYRQADGQVVTYEGGRVDYGVGRAETPERTVAVADRALLESRQAAEARGERSPRGSRPSGLVEVPPSGRGTDGGTPPSEGPLGQPKYSARPAPGFFSALGREVDAAKQPAASGDQWARYLAGRQGVKADEIKWTGLDDFLKERAGKRVTKQEVQDFLRQNAVEVREVTLGGETGNDPATLRPLADWLSEHADERRGDWNFWASVSSRARQGIETARADVLAQNPPRELQDLLEAKPTKFGSYTLPGGQNYRELLLTLPTKKGRGSFEEWASARGYEDNRGTRGLYERYLRGETDDSGAFRSGHYDEPNILAHVRFNERTDADGKRVLFIEEVQSDWAQKGRRQGFRENLPPAFQVVDKQGAVRGAFNSRAEAVAFADANGLTGIQQLPRGESVLADYPPSAPFVGSTEGWTGLAMKRVLRYAAENGFDRVAWTKGEQQAARYDLSRQVDSVWAAKNPNGTFNVWAIKDGDRALSKSQIEAPELPNIVGKELADKVVSQATPEGIEFTGLDLKVGGEGMKGFYDQILPSWANKYGKKWGAKVGETTVTTGDVSRYDMVESGSRWRVVDKTLGREGEGQFIGPAFRSGADAEAWLRQQGLTDARVHSLDITPAMKQSVMEGQPLFRATDQPAQGGIDRAAVSRAFPSGKVTDSPEGFLVDLPGDRQIRVRTDGDIEYNAEAFQSSYQRAKTEAEQIVGSWQRVDRGGIIALAKEAGQETVHHEAWHAAKDLALGAREKEVVYRRYLPDAQRKAKTEGVNLDAMTDADRRAYVEEVEAENYSKWNPREKTNSFFQKILDFFRNIYRAFKPNAESAFERVRSGKAFESGGVAEKGVAETRFSAGHAKSGGEEGINREWYKGGQFLPSTELPKQYRPKPKGGGTVEIEPFKRVPAREGYRPIMGMFPNDVNRYREWRDRINWAEFGGEENRALLDRLHGMWERGERWFPVRTINAVYDPKTRARAVFGDDAVAAGEAARRIKGRLEQFEEPALDATAPKYATAPKQPPQVRPIPPGAKPGQPPPAEAVQPAARPAPGISLPAESALQKFQRIVQDRLNRVGVVEKSVRGQGGTVRADIKELADAVGPKAAARVERTEQDIVNPLVKSLSEDGLKLEDLDRYLYAKHAPTRNKVISDRTDGATMDGSGMSDQEAAQILADFQAKGLTPKLDRAADFIRKARDQQIDVLLDGGLISKEQAKAWRDTMGDDYVPLRTAEVDEGIGTGQGFDIRGKEAKSATGRATKADSPTSAMLQQLQKAIVRAEKNKFDQEFARFVADNKLFEMDAQHMRSEIGADGKVKKVRDTLRDQEDFSYKVNGEKKRISIKEKDPILDRALRNMSAQEVGDFTRVAGKLTRAYSQFVTTFSPEFIATNFARDIQAAVASIGAEQGGKAAAGAVKNVPAAMKGLYRSLRDPKATGQWETLAREFKEDGGSVGWTSVGDAAQIEKALQSKIEASGPGALAATKRVAQGLLQRVKDVNGAVEGGVRLGLYKALRDQGVPRQKAATAARQVTIDFSKRGEAGPWVNSFYAFANANIQGTKRLLDVAVNNPKGRAIAGSIAAGGWALDQYNRSIAGDQDNDGTNDYDAIPEYVKERNLVIMQGEGKKPFLFPMPYGFNVVASAGRLASAVSSGAMKPGEAGTALASGLWSAFNPLGGEADIIQTLTPTALDPLVQDVMNRDFAGNAIRPERFPGSPKKPDSELYFRNVNPGARAIAQALNKASGGDKVTPGYVSVSPETIEHYTTFLSGGMGRTFMNTLATGSSLAKGETPSLRKVPFARRFVYEEAPGAQSRRYRENVQELEDLEARYESYREERNPRAREIPVQMLKAKRMVDSIDSRIRRLRKALGARPDLETQITELQTRANRIVAQAKRQAEARP